MGKEGREHSQHQPVALTRARAPSVSSAYRSADRDHPPGPWLWVTRQQRRGSLTKRRSQAQLGTELPTANLG